MTQVQPDEHDSNFQSDVWADELLALASRLQVAMELSEESFGGMAQALTNLINKAMKLKRSAVLGARPFEWTALRCGWASGFKPKTVSTRVGALKLRVPQMRDVPFYPSALEKGQRCERTLKLAIAAMYVQSVTTRMVTAVIQ